MTYVKDRPFQTLLALLALVLPTASYAQTTGRAPVPTKEQQQASAKLLDEGYQVTKATTPTKKQQLVKELMKVARDSNLKKEDSYVVLTTVISLSQELRDLPTMTAAVEQLVKSFEVAPLTERTRHLARYLETLNGKSAVTLKPVFDEVASLARSAAADDRYQDAGKLLDEIEAVLTKSQLPANLKQPMTDLRKEITAKKEKFEKFQRSLTVLESKPDDPDANFTVGQWFVVEETDWTVALPHLAKASKSKSWQAAAKLELTPDTEPVKIGDQWWALASSESDPAKRELMRHAGQWYQQALPKLSVLEKKSREKRLAQISALQKPNVAQHSRPQTESHKARAAMLSPATWLGKFRVENGELLAAEDGAHRLIFGDPKWVEYDYSLEYRLDRVGKVAHVFFQADRVGSSFWNLDIGGWGSPKNLDLLPCAFGDDPWHNPGRRWMGGRLHGETGRWYRIKVEVRAAKCTVYIDDAKIMSSEHAKLSQGRVGIGSHSSGQVRWRNFEVRGTDGKLLWKGLPNVDFASVSPNGPIYRFSCQGNEYAVLNESANWNDSQKRCAELGGSLAIIETEIEADELLRTLKKYGRNLWIGGRSDNATKRWVWHDDRPIKQSSTLSGADGNGAEPFLGYWLEQQRWNDFDLKGSGKSLCALCKWTSKSRADTALNDNPNVIRMTD